MNVFFSILFFDVNPRLVSFYRNCDLLRGEWVICMFMISLERDASHEEFFWQRGLGCVWGGMEGGVEEDF